MLAVKVSELLVHLAKLPPDAEVSFFYDGAARGTVDLCWLARSGEVVLAGCPSTVYNDSDRPAGAPRASAEPYWQADESLFPPKPEWWPGSK